MNLTDGAAAFDVSENGTLAYLPVELLRHRDRRGAGGPRGRRVARASRERSLQPPAPLPRRGPHRGGHPFGQLHGRCVGVPDRRARAAPGSPSEGGRDFGAEWTPDGRELIYSSERPFFDLYRRAADASRPAEPLVTGGYDRYTGAVSAGRPAASRSCSASPAAGSSGPFRCRASRTPTRYFANGFNLAHPALSPDGRWMAYDSDESGRVEVYVQSFPDPSSSDGRSRRTHGSEPMWTRGGRELVYRKGDSVMAVSIDLENGRSRPAERALCRTVPGQSGMDPASELRCLARRRAVPDDQAAGPSGPGRGSRWC